jgi:hypothetical protein
MTTIRTVAELAPGMVLRDANGFICKVFESDGRKMIARIMSGTTLAAMDASLLPAETLHPRTVGKAEVEKARNSGYVQAVNDNSARITSRGEWFNLGFDAALAAMGIEVSDV